MTKHLGEEKLPMKPKIKRSVVSNLALLVGIAILVGTGGIQILEYFQIRQAEAEFALQMEQLGQDTSTPEPTETPESTPTAGPTRDPALPTLTIGPTSTPGPTRAPKPTRPPLSSFTLLGTLNIPKMKLTISVVEGASADELRVGVGHVSSSAQVGQPGNVCLAGHRRGLATKCFANLDYLKAGDTVDFNDGKTTYRYIVYDSFIVEAEDNWVLSPIQGVEYGMTLISCSYPLFGPTQRLIVRAKLEGT
jgi:sortase A